MIYNTVKNERKHVLKTEIASACRLEKEITQSKRDNEKKMSDKQGEKYCP